MITKPKKKKEEKVVKPKVREWKEDVALLENEKQRSDATIYNSQEQPRFVFQDETTQIMQLNLHPQPRSSLYSLQNSSFNLLLDEYRDLNSDRVYGS